MPATGTPHGFGAADLPGCVVPVRFRVYPEVSNELHQLERLGRSGAPAGRRVPGPIRDIGRDLEANFKAVLQAQLAKLDLVSRTEFDVQAALLARTQAALSALEQRIQELEAKPGPQ